MSDVIQFDMNFELRRGLKSIEKFSEIFNAIREQPNERVLINFADYKYIDPHYAVLIAAIPYISKLYKVSSTIRINTRNDKFVEFITKTGIFDNVRDIRHSDIVSSKKKVPFIVLNDDKQGLEMSEKIINAFPVTISADLKADLVSKIYEIISNAFTHSKCSTVFCCGCLDTKGDFHFSIYDIGIGIPSGVNKYLGTNWPDEQALKWAWEKGNSTLNGVTDYPRGAGLDLLKEFAHKNNGEILMVSGKSFCKIRNDKDVFRSMNSDLLGTFFSMSIKKDSLNRYALNVEGVDYVNKS